MKHVADDGQVDVNMEERAISGGTSARSARANPRCSKKGAADSVRR